MKILTTAQQQLDLNCIDDEIEMTQFTVVDLGSNINTRDEPDIIFPKLIYLEQYIGAAVVCDIGDDEIILPLSWYVFIGDEDSAEVEIIPITELNARSFNVIATNPISGFRHHFPRIRIKEVLMDYSWTLPKIKNGQCLAVPINKTNLCVFISNSNSKIPNTVSPMDFL